jgi:hypothetical protein
MVGLTAAIHERLTGDATVAALCSTYAGAPAVFNGDPVPADATVPFVVISPPEAHTRADTKTFGIRRVRIRIRVISDQTSSTGGLPALEQLAERIVELLHRAPLTLDDGWTNYIADVEGPLDTPTSPDLIGLAVIPSFTVHD